MGKTRQSVEIDASLAEVWDHYFEPRGWPAWVEGFRAVEASAAYPEAGGSLRWRTTPAGRGTVTEHVLEHEPRTRHRIAFGDDYSEGQLQTSFEIAGSKTKVTQEIAYKVKQAGAFGPLTDRLFIRRQVRRSLAGSLTRLKREVEELTAASRSV
jgi:uncharacterized membrane protein